MIHYTVQKGDALWRIAAAHNLTALDLIRANGAMLDDPNIIQPGLILHIPEPEPEPSSRLGIFTTSEELEAWNLRARGLDDHNFHNQGDEWTNSPADWTRITANKDAFIADPTSYQWVGMSQNYPNPIINSGSWSDLPPQHNSRHAPEDIRDAAFWAMVLGSVHLDEPAITANVRDSIIQRVESTITGIMASRYNDFTNRQRFNPDNAGTGFKPAWLLALYLGKLLMAYDFCQVANPNVWSETNKTAFIQWLWDIEPWLGDGGTDALIHKRRDGWVDLTGVATDAGAAPRPGGAGIWQGSPLELQVHHKIDNHVPVPASYLTMVACLSELEAERSGFDVLTADDIEKGKEYTRWMVRSYLINEFVASAPGSSGGTGSGERAGFGQFYRARTGPSDDIKYAMEWFGNVWRGVDVMARAGDSFGYDLSTTAGVGGGGGVNTAGTVPADSYYSNPGPKTLHRALQQALRFTIETGSHSHPWRFGRSTGLNHRYDLNGTDDGGQSGGQHRSNDLVAVAANMRFADPGIRAIYDRSAPGAPQHPANPRQGRWNVTNGPAGTFPGVCFQYAYLENQLDPYPKP